MLYPPDTRRSGRKVFPLAQDSFPVKEDWIKENDRRSIDPAPFFSAGKDNCL